VTRTRAVFEGLAASALEQRVTGKEAFAAWRTLVRRYGEPAPGPFGEVLGMFVPPRPRRGGRCRHGCG
jgi:3-methyladenine DNA glycosylase/8-oxoguanine DNA glycosylase